MYILISILTYIVTVVIALSYIFVNFKRECKKLSNGPYTIEDFFKWQKKHYNGLMFVCLCPVINLIPALASIYFLLILPAFIKFIHFVKNIKVA